MNRYDIALGKKSPKKTLKESWTNIEDQKEIFIPLKPLNRTQEMDAITFLKEYTDRCLSLLPSTDYPQPQKRLSPTFYLDKL